MAEANIAAGLAVEMTLSTAGAASELSRLDAAIAKGKTAAVQAFSAIETAAATAIDTSGGVREMANLAQSATKAAGSIADEMSRAGVATKAALDTHEAFTNVVALTSAMSGEAAALVTLRREANASERAGESLSASLQRQIDNFGMTRDEVLQAKVAMAAFRAEVNGQTELAGRLREQADALRALQDETKLGS